MSRNAAGLLAALCAALPPCLEPVSAAELPTATPETVGMSSEKLAQIEAIVEKAVEDRETAGAVVLVLKQGKIVHFSAHGWQSIESKRPMQRDTLFRIYSMTKPVTSVAALMLWEAGRFDMIDPVSKYLPQQKGLKVYDAGGDEPAGDEIATANAVREMTVLDLLRHTSGLSYGSGNTPIDRLYRQRNLTDRGRSLDEFIDVLATLPLKYQPGSRFEYGVSTDVLGRLIEVWSGQTLDRFFRRRIFEKLDMRDTGFVVPAGSVERFAAMYGPGEEQGLKLIDAPYTSPYRRQPQLLSGGGGLVSTARDYARFLQMLLQGGELDGQRLLAPETVALMTQNHIPEQALPIVQGFPRVGWGFGLGFAVRVAADDDQPSSPVGECRWGGAASTHFWFVPQQQLGVIVMQQHRPFIRILEERIKPVVYGAALEGADGEP